MKWKGASGSGGLCPDAADSAWMLVRRGVVSKRWARSSEFCLQSGWMGECAVMKIVKGINDLDIGR